MKFLFYVDGEKEQGLGHMRRCESLATELMRRGNTVEFLDTGADAAQWLRERDWLIVSETAADISSYNAIIIDSYIIEPERIAAFKKQCRLLIGFHDFGEPNTDFSLLISSVYPEHTWLGVTRILAGNQYGMVHPDVLNTRRVNVNQGISLIVVSFGNRAEMANRASRVATMLGGAFPGVIVRAMARKSGAEIADAFAHADIAISGGGQTMLELLYLGVPTIVVVLSEDQKAQVDRALAKQAIIIAGNIADVDIEAKIAESVRGLYSVGARHMIHDSATRCVDGKGAERIATCIEEALA